MKSACFSDEIYIFACPLDKVEKIGLPDLFGWVWVVLITFLGFLVYTNVVQGDEIYQCVKFGDDLKMLILAGFKGFKWV